MDDEEVTSIHGFPLFQGDMWPRVIESLVRKAKKCSMRKAKNSLSDGSGRITNEANFDPPPCCSDRAG